MAKVPNWSICKTFLPAILANIRHKYIVKISFLDIKTKQQILGLLEEYKLKSLSFYDFSLLKHSKSESILSE